jgi:single-strand DNA-binding protein
MTMQCAAYGRLGNDPQARTTSTDKPMTICSIAVDVTPGNAEQQETLWLSVMAFGRQAEALLRHRELLRLHRSHHERSYRWNSPQILR